MTTYVLDGVKTIGTADDADGLTSHLDVARFPDFEIVDGANPGRITHCGVFCFARDQIDWPAEP
jgi:hypothetical protein